MIAMEESSITHVRGETTSLDYPRSAGETDGEAAKQASPSSSGGRAWDSSQIEKVSPSLIHWLCVGFGRPSRRSLLIQNRSLRGDAACV